MRTKLFLAFIFVVVLALVSNIVFERLVLRDFNDFLKGTEEDHIYWIMASIEGSYNKGIWDKQKLAGSLHWGLMLGFETYVEDMSGEKILSSTEILGSMNESMINRMRSLLELPAGPGEVTWYPLYMEGQEIGKLYVRSLEKPISFLLKEEIFKRRGKEFLTISFVIAGGGALILSILFTIYLSRPVRRLTLSAGKIAKGDFTTQVPAPRKIFKDEIDKLTESFNYMTEALKREDLLRKHLTANIAHELRTPLMIIRGNLEAIEDGIVPDPEKAIKNVSSEIYRLTSLVEGIEDITSAEASFFKRGSIEKIELSEFIENISEGMRKACEQKGLYLRTAGPVMDVDTYPEKLHIILKNLLTNAIKFTSDGGITIGWNNVDGYDKGFYINVDDTGKGVTKEEQERVFERFYKGEGSGGKGLGLAIAKELTEVLGGKIEVENIPGGGARFKLIF